MQCISYILVVGDTVAVLAQQWTCDSQAESWHHCIVALGKLLTPVSLCHQALQFGTGQRVISLVGKVTVGLMPSDGSLPLGL